MSGIEVPTYYPDSAVRSYSTALIGQQHVDAAVWFPAEGEPGVIAVQRWQGREPEVADKGSAQFNRVRAAVALADWGMGSAFAELGVKWEEVQSSTDPQLTYLALSVPASREFCVASNLATGTGSPADRGLQMLIGATDTQGLFSIEDMWRAIAGGEGYGKPTMLMSVDDLEMHDIVDHGLAAKTVNGRLLDGLVETAGIITAQPDALPRAQKGWSADFAVQELSGVYEHAMRTTSVVKLLQGDAQQLALWQYLLCNRTPQAVASYVEELRNDLRVMRAAACLGDSALDA